MLTGPYRYAFRAGTWLSGEQWIYGYIGWLVPAWPNSTDTLDCPAIVGSVVRTNQWRDPGRVVASFYAVRMV